MASPRLVPLVLAVALLAGTAAVPLATRAQEATPAANTGQCEIPFAGNYETTLAEAVEITESRDSTTANGLGKQQLRAYDVEFGETYAAIPRCWYPEQMMVVVEDGDFVLELGDDDVTVIADPAGQPIPLMAPTRDDKEPYFEEIGTETVQDATGSCTTICALPANAAMKLGAGSRVYLPGQTVCLWCLLNGTTGKLRVYAVVPNGGSFSWERLNPVAPSSAAANQFTPTRLRYNPGVNCRGG